MKKFIAVLASASIACTMFAFAGCGEGNEGVIKGNYKEPKAEELNQALSNIDLEKPIGDGIDLSAKFEGGFEMNGVSAKSSAEFGYKLTVDGNDAKGAGSASVSYSYAMRESGIKSELSGSYNAAVYNDSSYAYFALDGVSAETLKAKVDYTEIMEIAMGQLPVSMAVANETIDYTEITEILDALFIKVGLDTSNGVKLKYSVTEDTVWALVAQSGEIPPTVIPEIKKYVTFDSFKLDAYEAYNKDGALSQASLDVDIAVKISKEIGDPLDSDIAANIKGYFSLKAYNGKVELPANIASDESYTDYTDYVIDAIVNGGDDEDGDDEEYDIDVAGKTYAFTEVICISTLGEEEENALISRETANRRGTSLYYTTDGKCYWYSNDYPVLAENQMVYYWQEDESVFEVRNVSDLYNYDKIEGYSYIEDNGQYLVEYVDLPQYENAALRIYYQLLPY